MSVALSYDPLTHQVTDVKTKTPLHSLEYCCRRTILSRIGLENLQLVNQLPLPSSMKATLVRLRVSDFFIDAEKIPPESHSSRAFPATCLLTDSNIILKLVSSKSKVNKKDPNFLTSFEDGNQHFVIEQELKTLSTAITNCKTDNIRLKEKFIKSALLHLVNHLIKKKTPVTTHISSECIILHPNDKFSIQIVTNDDPNAQNMMPGASNAVYEAPEVLNNDNPDSRALVWSVGCILHEALALEPAFHDTSGTNPFQVYMNITNGVIPPTPSDGSEELQNLLEKCLIHNRGSRISLNELKEALSKS